MSNKVHRKDKTCLNCRYVVENKFCPNCGQENTDTRKTFLHLFVHFFEDLTHYENAFWRTIRNLLFKPASLTKEYLSGKRLSYLAPVRLYIFISFITFFILSILQTSESDENLKSSDFWNDIFTESNNEADSILVFEDSAKKLEFNKKLTLTKEQQEINKILESKLVSKTTKDTLKKILADSKKQQKQKSDFSFGFDNIKSLDSAKKVGEINNVSYWFLKKTIEVREKNTDEEIADKFIKSFIHNFPKALILYMPFFAFFLWLFHNKKRWYYFDHGIFTLHYFSFLLLIILLSKFVDYFFPLIPYIGEYLSITLQIIGAVWMVYYFYPAHHVFYGESRRKSFVKSFILFFINMLFILIFLLFFAMYSFISIH